MVTEGENVRARRGTLFFEKLDRFNEKLFVTLYVKMNIDSPWQGVQFRLDSATSWYEVDNLPHLIESWRKGSGYDEGYEMRTLW